MKNIAKYLVAFIIAVLCLIPPTRIHLQCTANTTPWMWGILGGGLLGFLFLFTKANAFIKLTIIFCFINSFLSSAPYMSLTLYLSVVAAGYFYLLCLQIEDWSAVYKVVQSLFFVSVLLVILQAFGKDTLLNYTQAPGVFFGYVNNPMMLASFITCLTPFLIIGNPLNVFPIAIIAYMSGSSGMVLTLMMALVFFLFFKIKNKLWYGLVTLVLMTGMWFSVQNDPAIKCFSWGGRGLIWKRAFELSNEKPWTGWGIGTFQVIFPTLSKDVAGGMSDKWVYEWTEGDWIPWRKTHNCWLQLLFELGRIGFVGVLGLAGYYIRMFVKSPKRPIIILVGAGLVVFMVNMTIHFPTRMIQTLIVMLAYLAYYERILKCEGETYYGL